MGNGEGLRLGHVAGRPEWHRHVEMSQVGARYTAAESYIQSWRTVREWSEAADRARVGIDLQLLESIVVNSKVAQQPAVFAGQDQVSAGGVVKLSQRDDRHLVKQVAAGPQILFRRIVTAEKADRGKTHRKDPARSDSGRSIVWM